MSKTCTGRSAAKVAGVKARKQLEGSG